MVGGVGDERVMVEGVRQGGLGLGSWRCWGRRGWGRGSCPFSPNAH